MVTLLILACLAHSDDCRVLAVASGFVNERQCTAYSPLMIAGWAARNPGIDITRAICTENPDKVIGAWMT